MQQSNSHENALLESIKQGLGELKAQLEALVAEAVELYPNNEEQEFIEGLNEDIVYIVSARNDVEAIGTDLKQLQKIISGESEADGEEREQRIHVQIGLLQRGLEVENIIGAKERVPDAIVDGREKFLAVGDKVQELLSTVVTLKQYFDDVYDTPKPMYEAQKVSNNANTPAQFVEGEGENFRQNTPLKPLGEILDGLNSIPESLGAILAQIKDLSPDGENEGLVGYLEDEIEQLNTAREELEDVRDVLENVEQYGKNEEARPVYWVVDSTIQSLQVTSRLLVEQELPSDVNAEELVALAEKTAVLADELTKYLLKLPGPHQETAATILPPSCW